MRDILHAKWITCIKYQEMLEHVSIPVNRTWKETAQIWALINKLIHSASNTKYNK